MICTFVHSQAVNERRGKPIDDWPELKRNHAPHCVKVRVQKIDFIEQSTHICNCAGLQEWQVARLLLLDNDKLGRVYFLPDHRVSPAAVL
jgi:hypothetical protein